MPAKLEAPAEKTDIRLFTADKEFMEPLLRGRNSSINEFVRDLFHRAANIKRQELGIDPVPPL